VSTTGQNHGARRQMKTVWIYVDTSKESGDDEVFADEDAAET
jgi:hypothetical protein